LFNVVKVMASRHESASNAHAAGSYPDIIDGYARAFCRKREEDDRIFSCNLFSHVNDGNSKLGDEIMEFLFIVAGAASSREAVRELSQNDDR